jgi:hypothetical protein
VYLCRPIYGFWSNRATSEPTEPVEGEMLSCPVFDHREHQNTMGNSASHRPHILLSEHLGGECLLTRLLIALWCTATRPFCSRFVLAQTA